MSHYVTCSNEKKQKNFSRSLGLLQLYKTLFRKKTKLSEKSIIIPLQTMIHKEDIKVTIKKESKRKYYDNCFRACTKNVKKACRDIKSVISLKFKDSDQSKIIKDKKSFLLKPKI